MLNYFYIWFKAPFLLRSMIAMTTREYILRLYLISCMLSGFVLFFLKGSPVTAMSVSGALGGGMGLILLPALVVVPWRRFQSKYGKETDRPFIVGLAVFLTSCLGYFVDAIGV
jgi:hypothetical protein